MPSAPGWPGCPVVFPLKFRNCPQFLLLPLLPLLRAISRWQGGGVPPHDVSHQGCFPKLCVSRCPGLLRAHLWRDLPPTPPMDSGAWLHCCVPRGAFLPVVCGLWCGLTCGPRRHRRVPVCPLPPLPSPAATLRCFSLCPCGPHPPLQAVAPSSSPAYFQMSLPHLLQTTLCSEPPPSPTTPQWDLLVFRLRLSPPWAEGSLQRSSTSCSCCQPL